MFGNSCPILEINDLPVIHPCRRLEMKQFSFFRRTGCFPSHLLGKSHYFSHHLRVAIRSYPVLNMDAILKSNSYISACSQRHRSDRPSTHTYCARRPRGSGWNRILDKDQVIYSSLHFSQDPEDELKMKRWLQCIKILRKPTL